MSCFCSVSILWTRVHWTNSIVYLPACIGHEHDGSDTYWWTVKSGRSKLWFMRTRKPLWIAVTQVWINLCFLLYQMPVGITLLTKWWKAHLMVVLLTPTLWNRFLLAREMRFQCSDDPCISNRPTLLQPRRICRLHWYNSTFTTLFLRPSRTIPKLKPNRSLRQTKTGAGLSFPTLSNTPLITHPSRWTWQQSVTSASTWIEITALPNVRPSFRQHVSKNPPAQATWMKKLPRFSRIHRCNGPSLRVNTKTQQAHEISVPAHHRSLRRRWSTENTDSSQIQPESLLKRLYSTPGGVAILEELLTLSEWR